MLRNIVQFAACFATLSIIPALLVLLTAVAFLPEILDVTQLMFFSLVFVPLLAFGLLESKQKKVMKQFMAKNQVNTEIIWKVNAIA